MKIQYLAIIFLIIIIPISLVLTVYNQSQINNLNLQLMYKTYLSDATHNAIKAFELNTVNNKYSQVADSLKRDVEASVNVFLNSMAKSLGTSGATPESVSEYVPAVLFTLYDGYYLYAPAFAEELVEEKIEKNGTEIIAEVSQEPKVEKFSHILKPYVYYTMRYAPTSSTDLIVNYSLDNYITIYGKLNEKYITKSGYLLEVNSEGSNLANITVDMDQEKLYTVLLREILSYYLPPRDLDNNSLEQIKNIYLSDTPEAKKIKSELKRYINFSQEGVYRTSLISNIGSTLLDNMLDDKYKIAGGTKDISLSDIPIAKIDEKFDETVEHIKVSDIVTIDEVLDCFTIKYGEQEITDADAKSYYVKGLQFSTWVNNNLGNISIEDARDVKTDLENSREIEEFKGKTDKIFNTKIDKSNNPEDITSIFAQHKNAVIKRSIQSNLTSAIARYNQNFFGMEHGYDLKMPVLTDNEWETIINKVTMVTFMQGMVLGNKVFNDYSVVSSGKNKEFVDINEIYYFNKKSSGKVYYHRLDCPELIKELDNTNCEIVGYKAIEYDIYKTKDEEEQLYYEYGSEIEQLRKSQIETVTGDDGNPYKQFKADAIIELSADYSCLVNGNYIPNQVNNEKLLFAQYTAIARERNKHYKINGYLDSYEIEYKKKNIILEPSTIEYTNRNIYVSVTTDLDNLKYYTENNGVKSDVKDWPIETFTIVTHGEGSASTRTVEEETRIGTVTIPNNTTLYVYSEEEPTRIAQLPITNIDKTSPNNVNITASDISQSNFKLNLTASDTLSGIDRYEIIVENKNNPSFKPFKDSISSGDTTEQGVINDRLPKTEYTCYVIVYDKAGNSTESNKITVTTK